MNGNGIQCGASCRWSVTGHSDAAKRIADAATLAWTFGGWDETVGKWMAFKLEDGTTDHSKYPSKREAARHVSNEMYYFFAKLHPGGMSVCEAEIQLMLHRDGRKAGFPQADPDSRFGGPDLIPRIGSDKVNNQLYALRKAGG